MEETSDLTKIIRKLKSKELNLIAIDGVDGSGKSTLAKNLVKNLGYLHINLDDYLKKNRGTYVENIKYDHLKGDILNSRLPIIIEGTCILLVLENMEFDHDLLIYIKIMSNLGDWRDEELWDVKGDVDDFIARLKVNGHEFSELMAANCDKEFDTESPYLKPYQEEIIRYHHAFKPHENADIIFWRTYANHRRQGGYQ